ncbi:MAG: CRISPR-associated helicase Cas3' [Deltaproteobacteria bacterium]|nr:CRISPR-associated helicase Cas3' [Deltaproteobacteria bacterium]
MMTPEEWFQRAPTPALALWGKARPGSTQELPAHPLLFHSVDVMVVAQQLIADRLSPALRRRLAVGLGLDEAEAVRHLSLVVALHDLGKATPSFQRKWPPALQGLSAKGLAAGRSSPRPRHHGVLSMALARAELRQLMPDWLARRLARAAAAHHGEFPIDPHFTQPPIADEDGGPAWASARDSVARALAAIVAAGPSQAQPSRTDHALTVLVAGLVAVADWIGSMAEVFRYEPPDTPIDAYLDLARARAHDALASAGLRAAAPPVRVSFQARFGNAPWPLHEAIEELAGRLDSPAMVIIEAPMGEGKTEAALYLTDALGALSGQRGIFFGLPTQATANQMLLRVERFLQERPEAGAPTQLVLSHGQAALSKPFERLLSGVYDEHKGGSVRAERWFVSRKRTLLASTAVGTIDQALLGVLRIKHGFVRLFGLAGKVVVFDEVHAYDTYTSELIFRLAEWLHALGASVVILSATLPSRRRAALLRTAAVEATPPAAYPRISAAMGGRVEVRTIGCRRPPTQIALEHLPDELDVVGATLIAAVAGGGCAGWIRNTIVRAQEAFTWLMAARAAGRLPPDTEIMLLHSRFPVAERRAREERLVQWLGPRSTNRPLRALVVGTQVFEQSIDIDFDILATDLAPVDLVLQRAGRLHRHAGRTRPARLAEAKLLITGTVGEAPPEWACRGIVYHAFPQLRTFEALRGRATVTLPDQIEPLVEQVYAEVNDADSPQVRLAAGRHEAGQGEHELLAARRLMPSPVQDDDPFADFVAHLEEDNPELHEALQARTRLGADGLTVVLLHDVGGRASLDPAGAEAAPGPGVPTFAEVRALLERSVAISHRGLVRVLARTPTPEAWSEVALLENVKLLLLRAGRCEIGGFMLVLDPDLGLTITAANTPAKGDED